MKYRVRAPSNIAIVKYMGKEDASINLPSNGSLSLTLEGLESGVEVEKRDGDNAWEGSLAGEKFVPLELGSKGQARILNHVERVSVLASEIFPHFGLELAEHSGCSVWSANTFPASAGIASSASSFAAMTVAVAWSRAKNRDAFRGLFEESVEFRVALAQLSRRGSGSSCRSMLGPWVLWQGEEVRRVEFASGLEEVSDFVLMVSSESKKISSSEAHLKVKTSPLWEGRVERAEQRIKQCVRALESGDFETLSEVAWAETWEMHSLFHTASEPFSYWEPSSLELLKRLGALRRSERVLITMDAGPNLHLLCKSSDEEKWVHWLGENLPGLSYQIGRSGKGPKLE